MDFWECFVQGQFVERSDGAGVMMEEESCSAEETIFGDDSIFYQTVADHPTSN